MAVYDADIIVVGAGPAGSAAATTAARRGCSVILLDRATFPRDKPCGDLIGARAMRAARSLGISEDVLTTYERLTGVSLTSDAGEIELAPRSRLGCSILANSDARVVPRRIFDSAMVGAAQRAGAELRYVHVRSVDGWDGTGRVIRGQHAGDAVELRARAIIVAGGYGCRIAADVAPQKDASSSERPRGIAMRGYFTGLTSPSRNIIFCLDEWVLPGYGWVFPLPDGSANIGIGTLVTRETGGQEHLHDLYRRFTQAPDSPIAGWMEQAEPLGKPRSWALDLGPRRRRLVADGLLVAGEAAALVGPMTGAGIAFALESGMRAAEVTASALQQGPATSVALAPYAQWVRRHHITWLRIESAGHWLISDPDRLRAILKVVRPLPLTPALGAKLLLNLG